MGKQIHVPSCYPNKESNTRLKMMHKTPMKTVKITYISSPVMVRACDASEFRSVVQQLTGKDSNTNKKVPRSKQKGYHNCGLMHQSVMQNGDDRANGSAYYNDISIMASSLDFHEDFFSKEHELSVFSSPWLFA